MLLILLSFYVTDFKQLSVLQVTKVLNICCSFKKLNPETCYVLLLFDRHLTFSSFLGRALTFNGFKQTSSCILKPISADKSSWLCNNKYKLRVFVHADSKLKLNHLSCLKVRWFKR